MLHKMIAHSIFGFSIVDKITSRALMAITILEVMQMNHCFILKDCFRLLHDVNEEEKEWVVDFEIAQIIQQS